MGSLTWTVWRRVLACASMVSVTMAALLVSSAADAASPSPSPSPIPQGCQLVSPQPEAPLKLNVVAVKELVKTIVMEKEIFNCYDVKSTLAQVKDVQTFIELTGRGKGGKSPGVQALHKSVVADMCIKDLKAGRVSCKSISVPLGVTKTPLARCTVTKGTYPFTVVQQPTHPVEMSTVTLAKGLVKTVAVEKEVFDCAGLIGDLYLFTEIVESANGAGFRGGGTQFAGIMCLKDETTARVVACKLFTPRRAG